MNTIEEMFSKIQAEIKELKYSINGQIHIYKTILTLCGLRIVSVRKILKSNY